MRHAFLNSEQPIRPDITILRDAVGEPEQMQPETESDDQAKAEAPKNARRLTLRKPNEILAMTFDDSDIILEDRVLAAGQSLVIAGQPGLGKSRLSTQLPGCVIAGRKFLKFATAGRDKKWLILQTQNGNRRLKMDLANLRSWLGEVHWERFNELVTFHTIETDSDSLVSVDSEQNQLAILEAIEACSPDVIIIDPLDEFAFGDLNRDADMRATISTLARLCRKGNPNRSIVVLHHALTGRGGAAKATGYDRASFARNSKVLLAWTRAQINLAAVDEENYDRIVVACGKNSNGREFEPFGIRIDPGTMIYECDGTIDVQAWSSEMSNANGRGAKKKPVPNAEQFLALFQSDAKNVRACLMSAVQLREKFRAKGWDHLSAPALRDECEASGALKIHRAPHNEKLAGLPDMVAEFERQQSEKGTVMEAIPIIKPCKRRKN